jgi:phage baseplate assembly protein W
MAVTTTEETQIVREAPELEAIKMNLLSEAAKLAYRPEFGGQLPEYQVASFSPAQRAALQAGMDQGIGSYLPYIEAGNVALGQGLGATQVGQIAAAGAAGTYDPRSAVAFMNPYQQAVTEQSLRDIRRQADIAGQSQAAQAVRTGAFGGTREGVQRAEMERNVQNLMAQQIAQGYAQNYAQAQQAAMQAEEAARQRQLGIGQLFGQLGQQAGQLGVQQAALGQTAQQCNRATSASCTVSANPNRASRSGKLMQFVHRRCKECTLPTNRLPSCRTFIRAHRRRKWQQHLQRSRRQAPSNRLQALLSVH